MRPLGASLGARSNVLKKDLHHPVFSPMCSSPLAHSCLNVSWWLYIHNPLNTVSATLILLLIAQRHTLFVNQSPLSSLSPDDALCTPRFVCTLSKTHARTSSHRSWHRCLFSLVFKHSGEPFCFALAILQLPLKGSRAFDSLTNPL